ncbi:RNA chaperone ProQ [Candidatus Williamhamiltonella defendens]|nr:RNA chaperone ProQ [Candidatus Hamiltonella defensa]
MFKTKQQHGSKLYFSTTTGKFMKNESQLNRIKSVLTFLSQKFPRCFVLQGKVRPLKIGIFQDLTERLQGDELTKTQLRSAVRFYTLGWRYLFSMKSGAKRIDLEGFSCETVEEQHEKHAQKQLSDAKIRRQKRKNDAQMNKKSQAIVNRDQLG